MIGNKAVPNRRCSNNLDNGEAEYHACCNYCIISGHALTYHMQVSTLNSKNIAKINCHWARSGFSKCDSDLLELVTAQYIGPASARPAATPMQMGLVSVYHRIKLQVSTNCGLQVFCANAQSGMPTYNHARPLPPQRLVLSG